MNRYKQYWSAMGIEPRLETHPKQARKNKHKKQLLKMMNEYSGVFEDGFQDLLTLFREIYEEQREREV